MTSPFPRLAVAACALVLAACSGKKDVTNPPGGTAAITVTAGSPTLSVAQTTTGSSAITVGRTNFSGDVTLTAENLPTGVTATFTPATLSSGATASSIAFAVAGTATASTTPTAVTIRARGTGVSDATASIALTVTASATGAVAIAATPTTASITAGQTTSTAIAITRSGGFAGGVNFTVTGAPTGVTTTLSSANPVTANAVTLSVATLASVTPGPVTLTVRANATGLTEATATFTVNVAAPPANSVTWRYCDPARYPVWLAVQDGETGPWTRATEESPGQYTVSFGQPRVGIATVTNEGTTVVTQVTYYGTSEVATKAGVECRDNPVPGTKTLTGTITGFSSSQDVALVSMGAALSNSADQSTPGFTITKVPNGAVDLIAVRANVVSGAVARMLLTRNTNFTAGGSLGILDLGGGSSFAPASAQVTFTGPNDAVLLGTTLFRTANGSSASFRMPTISSGSAVTYQGVPDANLIASDLQSVQVEQSVGTTITRFLARYLRGPSTFATPLAIPLDPALPAIAAITGSAYPRATASGTISTDFNDRVTVSFTQSGLFRRWEVGATPAGRTSPTAYTFTLPDFSAVAGWQNTWALGAGATTVTTSFFGLTGANADGTPTTGTEVRITRRSNSFTF